MFAPQTGSISLRRMRCCFAVGSLPPISQQTATGSLAVRAPWSNWRALLRLRAHFWGLQTFALRSALFQNLRLPYSDPPFHQQLITRCFPLSASLRQFVLLNLLCFASS